MELAASPCPPLLIAPDAQASVEAGVSGAFLIVDPIDGSRWGRVWTFDKDDLSAIGFPDWPCLGPQIEKRSPISAAEAAVVAATYVIIRDECPEPIRKRDVVH